MAIIDNLISSWELDEVSGNRADSHGSNTLTDNNTVGSTTGVLSNAADFVGASAESLSVTDNGSLSLAGSFTWAVWLKTSFDASAAGEKGLIAKDLEVVITHGNGGTNLLSAFVWDSVSGFISVTHADNMADGNWNMWTCKYDHSDKKVRVSKNAGAYTVSASALSNGPADTANALEFGAWAGASNWTGAMDMPRLWTRALTDDEVTWLYNNGSGRSYADMLAAGGTPFFTRLGAQRV